MPILTAKEAQALKEQLNTPLVRVPQYRQVVDRKMTTLEAFKSVMAPDYQKAWVPAQTAIPNKALFRLTNIMASNAHEFAAVVRSTDQSEVNLGQDYEDAHVAIDELIFTTEIKRKMRGFLADSYGVVAIDVRPAAETLAKYADRGGLEKYAESDAEGDDEPSNRYRKRYQQATDDDEKKGRTRTKRERHEDAYDAVTTDAMLADGLCITVRVPDILTFRGFQTDGDPHCFAIGMEVGQKQLNPLLEALGGYGLKVADGLLYIEDESDKRKRGRSASYEALGVGMIAEAQSSTGMAGETWVEYCQIRTCEETLILIEHPAGKKGKDDEPGVLIRVPNLFGNKYTGYFLIEGDAKSRSGSLEDRYEPPLLAIINEAQHYNLLRSAYESMAIEEATRAPYVPIETGQPVVDPTQETKSKQPQDGVQQVAGEIRRVETTGAKLEEMLQHSTTEMHLHEPLIGLTGTGTAGESGQHLARVQTAVLTELTTYQGSVAEVCKRVHYCIDSYVVATGETIKMAYVAESGGEKRTKAEVRELTPQMAKLPLDVTYTIGSRTPEGDYAAEQMSRTRWLDGVYGLTEHQEQIGIKDPVQTQFDTGVDSMLASVKGVLEGEIAPLLKEYAQGAVRKAFGPPPVILGPDGMPLPPSGAPMGAPTPMPGGMPQPVQTANVATPVAAGGFNAVV